ncbi:MAG: serine/threonine-protein kinase [Planctomycetota bacterium]
MTLARNEEDQERLITLVRRALDRMDAGEAVEPRTLCAEWPHLLRPLAEVLGLTDELAGLQQEALREDPLAGLLLAQRYQLRVCLGRGAMGVVYEAEDRELRRDVAVKILDARLFRDEQAEQRFQREAEALAALQHEHVVAVFDRGRTPEGIHYLVMERLEGLTLAELIAEVATDRTRAVEQVAERMQAPQPEGHWPRLCAAWGKALAEGLAAAHRRQLVHRDVKPSNVFLARPGRPVLLDFGIAARADGERLTATQTTLGTPWYMAPEQVAAGGLVTSAPTLDVYGLGATLYHLLAGRPPYEGDARTVLAALRTDDPPPLLRLAPELPRDLVAIVEKCLERRPEHRYADGAALARDLDAFLRHLPVTARPLHPLARRLRQWRRAPARPMAIAALTLVTATAVIAWPIWSRQQAAQLRQEQERLYAELPSLLAIEGWPDERVLSELSAEHERAIAQLDRLLALDASDLPVRLWRACLLLDLDRRDEAARDLQAIAAQHDSAFFRELAKRYAASDATQQGTLAVDVDGLPEPTSARERYVAGFHELRNRHRRGWSRRADALLADAAQSYLPARDLRLLTLAALAEGSADDERLRLLQQLYDETVALEQIYGRETARTQAMRGAALVLWKRYQDAIAPLERSLQLRPERHGPHHNLGIALRRTGRLDDAEHHLREALRLRPFAWNSKQTLAQVRRDRGDFDGALALAAELPDEGPRHEAWQQPQLVGTIELARATTLWVDDEAAGRAAVERAVAAFERSLAVRKTERVQEDLAVAKALRDGGVGGAMVPFATSLLRDPTDPYQLANMAFLVPRKGLDARQAAWVAAVLRQIAIEHAAGDAALQARLKDEIDLGLRGYR